LCVAFLVMPPPPSLPPALPPSLLVENSVLLEGRDVHHPARADGLGLFAQKESACARGGRKRKEGGT
jgi:hypothetical protein